MYFLHIIGAFIKEKATGPLVQKLKRHHFPHATSAPRIGKNAQSLLTFEKTLPKDCLLKNQRGTALGISRVRLPTGLRAQKSKRTALQISRARLQTGLISQKSKRHCSPNLESQTSNRITCSKIEEAPPSESREPDSQQDYFLKNRRNTAIQISRVRLLIRLLSQKSKRHRYLNLENQIPDKIACSKTEETLLSELREPDFLR
ncbi:hypothetical protein ACFXTH_046548 [Malus domestica]